VHFPVPVPDYLNVVQELHKRSQFTVADAQARKWRREYMLLVMLFVAIEYTQHLIEQKAAQEKKLEELRKEVLALKIMKS